MPVPAKIEVIRSELTAACEAYRVGRLELFGSATRGDFDEQMSDLDFLVEFLPGSVDEAAERYFGLLGRLQEILQRPVDLVMRSALRNPYVLAEIDASRELIYAA